jgi:hypothetical protein
MDSYVRIGLTIGVAIFIKTLILGWWGNFKARKALEPIPMKLHGGVYRPWGIVQKVQFYGGWIGLIYLVQFSVLLALLIYVWTVGPLF